MADRFRPVPPPADDAKPAPLPRRLFWFAALALGGFAVVAIAAYLLRALLFIG